MLENNALKIALVSEETINSLLPILQQAGVEQITQISPLSGGLSNHNYYVQTPTAAYVLRVNSEAAELFCRREQELFYWQQLAKAQLAPSLYWVSEDKRYYLSAFIHAEPLPCQTDPTSLAFQELHQLTDTKYLRDICEQKDTVDWQSLEYRCSAQEYCLGQVAVERYFSNSHPVKPHFESPHFKASFPNRAHELLLQLLLQLKTLPSAPDAVSVTAQWQKYQGLLMSFIEASAFSDAEHYAALRARAEQLMALQVAIKGWCDSLEACLLAPQFCHRDLNPHNVLLKDNRLYCIDFEYATSSHPLCELAVVLATHNLTPLQRQCVVQEYLTSHPGLTADAPKAVPAAIELYWVFACYWALLMAMPSQASGHRAEYLAWFDEFCPLISSPWAEPNNIAYIAHST